MTLDQTQAASVIDAVKILWAKNQLAAGDGNFSFKAGGDVWISPSGVRKCALKPKDFVKLESSRSASSESLMHKKVYELAPKAQVVFHAHPPRSLFA